MSNKLTNAYALHAELEELQKSLLIEQSNLRSNKHAQRFFSVATWIIYLLFAASMYAAPLWILQTFFTANSGNYIAISVLSAFLLVFPTALSWGKDAGYKALSKRGINPFFTGLIIAFFISSGIYFEMTSATSQQQEKAHQQAATTLGASITAPPTVAIDTSLADKIAKASKKLAQCQANLGKPGYKHCDGDKADVASLQASQAAASAASVQAVGAAVNAQQERVERERDNNALPIAKTFATLFATTMATGSVIAAAIAAFIFEISHSLTIYNEWRIQIEIERLQALLKQAKINYFHHTGKQFEATDFKEGEIIDLVSMRENGKIEHFNDRLQDGVSPTPAMAKREPSEWEEKPRAFPGFVNTDNMPKAKAATDDRPFMGFKDPKKQAALDALNLAQGSEDRKTKTYRTANREGYEGFQDTALDAPVNRPTPRTVPAKAEQPEQTVYTVPEQSPEQPEQKALEQHDDLYPVWCGSVKNKQIALTARGCQSLIEQRKGARVSMREAAHIWNTWGNRGIGEGYLMLNPDYTSTNRKLKFILA